MSANEALVDEAFDDSDLGKATQSFDESVDGLLSSAAFYIERPTPWRLNSLIDQIAEHVHSLGTYMDTLGGADINDAARIKWLETLLNGFDEKRVKGLSELLKDDSIAPRPIQLDVKTDEGEPLELDDDEAVENIDKMFGQILEGHARLLGEDLFLLRQKAESNFTGKLMGIGGRAIDYAQENAPQIISAGLAAAAGAYIGTRSAKRKI